ncbi:hypothetical protein CSB37_03905 [bacterium DOLZORAL124_38_8]|nr:MAG: hypothetical protein CSB37_03905 [bacterium DOLZORAL124_38_8]
MINRYLWGLLTSFLLTFGGALYLVMYVSPQDSFPWMIVGLVSLLGGCLFSFFSLFLFFLAELRQKKTASIVILKRSMRRAGFVALFGILYCVVHIFGVSEIEIVSAIFLFFLFLEIYYSMLVKK